jgi:hypothetical protein
MKRWLIILLFIISSVTCVDAQKINLEKWVSHTVDSLRNKRVDTIEYYHAWCCECEVTRRPPNFTDTSKGHECDVVGSTGCEQISTLLIYKQNHTYYSLPFNCGYPPIKKDLKNIKSLDYFISLIPVLSKRDSYNKEMRRKHKFNPPMVVDGGYEEAILYISGRKRSVYMQDDQKTTKVWRTYFWIDKQTKLLALLESETTAAR